MKDFREEPLDSFLLADGHYLG